MKMIKVITVCFRGERPAGSIDDRDELKTTEDSLKMIIKVLENEKTVDAGLDMDTLVVNNDLGYDPGREYLNSIEGTQTQNGFFKIMHRQNIGRSFGGYNAAFEKYQDDYEYWLFSEDDLYYHKDGYAKHYLDILNKNNNCAFVATIGIGRPNHETKHAHGGQGFTHRDYMRETIPLEFNLDDGTNKQAYKQEGSLAYYLDKNESDMYNTRLHVIHGEVPFTYSLVRLGYDICVSKNSEEWYKIYGK